MIILHQVNCFGVMGGGFAKYVRETFPNCYLAYRDYCNAHKNNRRDLLGSVYIWEDQQRRVIVINMFSQYDYGHSKVYTDYRSMDTALAAIRRIFPDNDIVAPYLLGCGLAGGDWNVVEPMLQKYQIRISKNIDLVHGISDAERKAEWRN